MLPHKKHIIFTEHGEVWPTMLLNLKNIGVYYFYHDSFKRNNLVGQDSTQDQLQTAIYTRVVGTEFGT